MKKIVALALVCSVLSGCHYLGEPEAYTVVDEETAPVVAPAPVPTPQPVRPVAAPVQPACGCGYVNGVKMGACQINPGVSGPLMIRIPEQAVCVQ